MKRIICAFVALFMFISFNSKAQNIEVNIGSASGDIGTIVSVPVNIQLPGVSQTIQGCQGSFQLSNPSIAQIVGFTEHPGIGANIVNPGTLVFLYGTGSNLTISGTFMTIDIQITGEGCTDVILADHINPPSSATVQFIMGNGTVFDQLGTNILVDEGEVCSNCNSFIQEVGLETSNNPPYFLNQSGHSLSNYADYTSTCITEDNLDVAQQLTLALSQANLYVKVYLDNDANGSFETLQSSGYLTATNVNYGISSGDINPGAGMRIIVSDQAINNPTDIPNCGEVEDYVFCDGCSCDPNDLVLGPITISQMDPDDCDFHLINIPPVLGCSDTEVSENYNFRFFKANGLVLPPETGINTTLDGTFYSFPGIGEYVVAVTYTMTDDSGCTHEVGPVYQTYNYTGCDCSILPPPTNLNCSYLPGNISQTISWDPVQNAASYDIELTYNDPSCCKKSQGATSTITTSTNLTYSLHSSYQNCFSWRVRAVCTNGSKSAWSSLECSCAPWTPFGGGGPSGGKSANQTEIESVKDGQIQILAVPNPASNQVQITMSTGIEITLDQAEVIIHDLSGKTVYQSNISLDETKTVDVSSFTPGMYVIKIVDNDTTLSTEKLIVQ